MRSTQLLLLAPLKWQLGFCSCCILSSKICPNCTCTQLFLVLTVSLYFVAPEDYLGASTAANGLRFQPIPEPRFKPTKPSFMHYSISCSCTKSLLLHSTVFYTFSNVDVGLWMTPFSLNKPVTAWFWSFLLHSTMHFTWKLIAFPWRVFKCLENPLFYNKSFEHLSIQLSVLRMISFMRAYLLCCIYGYWIVFHSWGEMARLTRSSLVGIYEF